MTNDFFARNYVWQVYFEVHGPVAEITLSYRRALPDGTGVKFDEDPDTVLNRVTDQDDQLVMDGFLALIPEGELLSCAMRVVKRILLIWEYQDYQHIFAEYDKHVVKRAFDANGLFNTDSSIDVLFIGGDRAAHETTTIISWAKTIQRDILQRYEVEGGAAWNPVLEIYKSVIYTQTTEIHMLTHNKRDPLERARMVLKQVAARYQLVLPPETPQ